MVVLVERWPPAATVVTPVVCRFTAMVGPVARAGFPVTAVMEGVAAS